MDGDMRRVVRPGFPVLTKDHVSHNGMNRHKRYPPKSLSYFAASLGDYRSDSSGRWRIAASAGSRPPKPPMSNVNRNPSATVFGSTTISKTTLLGMPSLLPTMVEAEMPLTK